MASSNTDSAQEQGGTTKRTGVAAEASDATTGRRDLLKKALVGGAVAWVAPTVVSSAAAAQGSVAPLAPGTYRAQYTMTCPGATPTFTRTPSAPNGGGCTPSTWNNLPEYPDTDISIGTTSTDYTFVLLAPNCTYDPSVLSQGKCCCTGNTCVTATQGGQSAAWSRSPASVCGVACPEYSFFNLVMDCV